MRCGPQNGQLTACRPAADYKHLGGQHLTVRGRSCSVCSCRRGERAVIASAVFAFPISVYTGSFQARAVIYRPQLQGKLISYVEMPPRGLSDLMGSTMCKIKTRQNEEKKKHSPNGNTWPQPHKTINRLYKHVMER